jgi:hypothetical protein
MHSTVQAADTAIGSIFPRAAKGVIAVLLTASVAACAVYDIRTTERLRAEDEQACVGSGYKPGTNQLAKCLQDHNLMRMPTTRSEN